MSQFIEQLSNDLADLKLKDIDRDEQQFLFEAFADFFTKNAAYMSRRGILDEDTTHLHVTIVKEPK